MNQLEMWQLVICKFVQYLSGGQKHFALVMGWIGFERELDIDNAGLGIASHVVLFGGG